MGAQPFYGTGPHLLQWANSQNEHVKIIKSGIPNHLTYCVTLIAQKQFTNVAIGPQTGNP